MPVAVRLSFDGSLNPFSSNLSFYYFSRTVSHFHTPHFVCALYRFPQSLLARLIAHRTRLATAVAAADASAIEAALIEAAELKVDAQTAQVSARFE